MIVMSRKKPETDDPEAPDATASDAGLAQDQEGLDQIAPEEDQNQSAMAAALTPRLAEQANLAAWLEQVYREPYRYDLFHLLRKIEAMTPHWPRLGLAFRPTDEPLRVGQDAFMNFAQSPVAALVERKKSAAPLLLQRAFGLLGPNGPMPLHFTEYVRDRRVHHGDETLSRFLDLFTHRFALMFFRAFAQGQPVIGQDRKEQDRFSHYIGSMFGLGDTPFEQRDAAPDPVKRFFAGHLASHTRRPDGLAAMLSGYFRLPVTVEPFLGRWMRLPPEDYLRLKPAPSVRRGGFNMAALGRGAVLGKCVWDRQHGFRINIGAMSLSSYESFIPGGDGLPALVSLTRQYLGRELDWNLKLVLQKEEVPALRLSRGLRLGYTSWLGTYRRGKDAADLDYIADARVPLPGTHCR